MIRPLVAVTEAEATHYAKESELPIIGCCCPACGDLGLQRQRVKRLIAELEVEHPEVKNSMIKRAGQRRAPPSARYAPEPAGGAAPPRRRAGEPVSFASQRTPRTTVPCRCRSSAASLRCGRWFSGCCRRASVSSRQSIGRIGAGLLVFVGVARRRRSRTTCNTSPPRSASCGSSPTSDGRMNRSVVDTGGAVLVVSQFTLHRRLPQGPAAGVRRRRAAGAGAGAVRGRRAGAARSAA